MFMLGWRHPGFQFPRGHTGSLHPQPGSSQRVQETWHRYYSPLLIFLTHTANYICGSTATPTTQQRLKNSGDATECFSLSQWRDAKR